MVGRLQDGHSLLRPPLHGQRSALPLPHPTVIPTSNTCTFMHFFPTPPEPLLTQKLTTKTRLDGSHIYRTFYVNSWLPYNPTLLYLLLYFFCSVYPTFLPFLLSVLLFLVCLDNRVFFSYPQAHCVMCITQYRVCLLFSLGSHPRVVHS